MTDSKPNELLTIDVLLTSLITKLLDKNIKIKDNVTQYLKEYLIHFTIDHKLSLAKLGQLINGFIPTTISHNAKKQCQHTSLSNIKNQCKLSYNWGITSKWAKDGNSIRNDVFTIFSSSIINFIAGLNDNNKPLLLTTTQNTNKSVSLFVKKRKVRALISSKRLSRKELKEAEKNYDLVIHGISRILNPSDFMSALMILVRNGVSEIRIPDNKQSETRLSRDFDKEALGNFMLLARLINVKIGGELIKKEDKVLGYCAKASKMTGDSQKADIRKIQAEWVSSHLKKRGDEKATMGLFKGAFNKILTRSIAVDSCRNNSEVIEYFKDTLQSDLALVSDEVLAECIKTSIHRAYVRMISKHNGSTIELFKEYFKFDEKQLLIDFKEMSIGVKNEVIQCPKCEDGKLLENQSICSECQDKAMELL